MQLLGRDLGTHARNLAQAHRYAWYAVKCVRLFRHPVDVLWAYAANRRPRRERIELRTGMTIDLSDDPADVITVFTVFVREDYGRVPPGGSVVDIGANIGVFALFAIHCGAHRVLAYEPSAGSFEILRRNIEANGLDDRVTSHRVAVTDQDGQTVRFPRRSSVYNAIVSHDTPGDWDRVPTTTLEAILRAAPDATLLKVDCEGAELAILESASDRTLRALPHIRLEYHGGMPGAENRKAEVVSCLAEHGFALRHVTADDAVGGVAWFSGSTTS